ncbi:MAG: hypothetical protein KGJ88_11095 [Verrucomicrobiota bacterium]|nr:hypothetical protein [Verrucomicrobiota bacterium]
MRTTFKLMLRRITVFPLFFALFLPSLRAYGVCTAEIECITTGATWSKHGFLEFCNPSSPVKYYLVKTEIGATSATELEWNTGPSNPPPMDDDSFDSNTKTVTTLDETNGPTTYDYTGTSTYSFCDYGYSGTESGSVVNHANGQWDQGGIDANYDGAGLLTNDYANIPSTNLTITTTCEQTFDSTTTSGSWGDSTIENSYNISHDDSSVGLSKQYTDEMLKSDTKALIPPFGTNWESGGSAAGYWLSDDHSTDGMGRMKYRFYVSKCYNEKEQSYELTWLEVTDYPTGPPNIQHRHKNYTGDGNPAGQYIDGSTVDVPAQPSFISEIAPSATLIPSSPPGSGGAD